MSVARQSIQSRVLAFALLTCASILIPIGGGLFILHWQQTEARLNDSIAATARITASNVAAAVAFEQPSDAADILNTLHHDSLITSARIFDAKGQLFAYFPNGPVPSTEELDEPASIEVNIENNDISYGRLHITSNLNRELRRTLMTWGAVYVAAFLLAGSLVYILARRFHSQVGAPIIELARTALRVAHERDYDTRAPLSQCTEVAELAIAINFMLTEIERRDKRLASQVQSLHREVSERSAAEETLRQNQQAMNRLSREAGMAEVASGVIHNIGNTLTSISISSDLIATRLANTRNRPLATLSQLLDPASPQTAVVFTTHADGAELRTLLGHVCTNIDKELYETTQLVGILQSGNNHLKQIVSTQQSIARTAQRSETFILREVLQEALLLAQTICRNPIPVEECPMSDISVYADRSLIVQIILNLLINAQESVAAHAPSQPKIVLTTSLDPAGLVCISLTDNGEGISSDRLISIFTYGYTTKPTGNGFGLHNSANTARMMGGDLTVISPGLGLGATFTLRIPMAPHA